MVVNKTVDLWRKARCDLKNDTKNPCSAVDSLTGTILEKAGCCAQSVHIDGSRPERMTKSGVAQHAGTVAVEVVVAVVPLASVTKWGRMGVPNAMPHSPACWSA